MRRLRAWAKKGDYALLDYQGGRALGWLGQAGALRFVFPFCIFVFIWGAHEAKATWTVKPEETSEPSRAVSIKVM